MKGSPAYIRIYSILFIWWAGLDSNQRIPKEAGLQPAAIAAMRPTHIEAEGWHRRSISLTALLL